MQKRTTFDKYGTIGSIQGLKNCTIMEPQWHHIYTNGSTTGMRHKVPVFCLYGFGATIDVRQLIQATSVLLFSLAVRLLDVGAQAVLQPATLVFFVYFGIELLLD